MRAQTYKTRAPAYETLDRALKASSVERTEVVEMTMEEFAVVAVAHFVALLIPGVDFLLIARSALTGGLRNAASVCLGVALANAVFIAAAFSGLSVVSHPAVLDAIQLAGGGFLIWMGIAFVRADPRMNLASESRVRAANWARHLGLGFTTGILNPKNALFYLSLAAAIQGAGPATLVGYGVWMFSIVLIWDLCLAALLSSGRRVGAIERALSWLVKGAGVFLMLFGAGMLLLVLAV